MLAKSCIICFLSIFSTLSFGQILPDYVPSNGLVGWWPFSGNANDMSGNGRHGAVNGPVLTTDRVGTSNSAYYFDGFDNLITVAPPNVSFAKGLTISIWCKLEKSTGKSQFLVVRGNDNTAGHFHVQFNQQSYAQKFGAGINEWTTTPGIYSANTYTTPHIGWRHLVYTYDNNKEYLYVDSELVGEVSFPGQIGNNSSPILFGNGYKDYNNYYRVRGSMDDIGIWNRALSEEEIKSLYFANESAGFSAFFNSTNERLVIRAGKYAGSPGYKIRICNDLGKRIYQKPLKEAANEINAVELGANGVYFVYLINPQNRLVEVQKVIVTVK